MLATTGLVCLEIAMSSSIVFLIFENVVQSINILFRPLYISVLHNNFPSISLLPKKKPSTVLPVYLIVLCERLRESACAWHTLQPSLVLYIYRFFLIWKVVRTLLLHSTPLCILNPNTLVDRPTAIDVHQTNAARSGRPSKVYKWRRQKKNTIIVRRGAHSVQKPYANDDPFVRTPTPYLCCNRLSFIYGIYIFRSSLLSRYALTLGKESSKCWRGGDAINVHKYGQSTRVYANRKCRAKGRCDELMAGWLGGPGRPAAAWYELMWFSPTRVERLHTDKTHTHTRAHVVWFFFPARGGRSEIRFYRGHRTTRQKMYNGGFVE